MAGMEIHQLEMLRELGALGSVKAVAETLLVTPSAVSQQLAALQKTVEVPLTRKEGRNLVLTEAGQVLADAGAAVVSAMADAKMAIGAYHGSPAAPVTLSGFHSAGQALFAPLARLLDGPGQPRILLSDEDVVTTIGRPAPPHVEIVSVQTAAEMQDAVLARSRRRTSS